MALTDMDFYAGRYGGEYDGEIIMPLLERAERDIRCVCSEEAQRAFRQCDTAETPENISFAVKWAACVQAEYLAERSGTDSARYESGGDIAAGGDISGAQSEVVSSVKLGDFSVSFGGSSSGSVSGGGEYAAAGNAEECARGNLCGEALLILDRLGLLYRGGVIV